MLEGVIWSLAPMGLFGNVFLFPPFVLGTGKLASNGSTQGQVLKLELNWK